MKRQKLIHGLILFLIAVSMHVSGQLNPSPPVQAIPRFQFVTLEGKPFTDMDLPKGTLLFIMYFDPDCDHCQHAIKKIGEQYGTFKKTKMFLVSMDDAKKTRQFMTTYGRQLVGKNNVTILVDQQQQFIVKFNPIRPPSMFLFSREKKLLEYEDNPESVFRLVNTINKNVQ